MTAAALVDVEDGQPHRREHTDSAQADVEDKVGKGEVVDTAVLVEEGVVQPGVAHGDDEGEDGGCQGYVAKVLRPQLSHEDDGSDPVDQASGVGTSKSVSGASGDAPESRSLGLRHHRRTSSVRVGGSVMRSGDCRAIWPRRFLASLAPLS